MFPAGRAFQRLRFLSTVLVCAAFDVKQPAKLYFRHGAVGSAKSLALLAAAHTFEGQGKQVVVIKPAIDQRFGKQTIASRAGLSREADILVTSSSDLPAEPFVRCPWVLVDEAQFLSAHVVEQLRALATSGVPVICYGLRTDFRSQSFEGSRRLFELADTIEEIKTTCTHCDRKAVFNLKHTNGVPTVAGPQLALGSEELYLPVCSLHYSEGVSADALTAYGREILGLASDSPSA